jgi:hypothetical protein
MKMLARILAQHDKDDYGNDTSHKRQLTYLSYFGFSFS